MIFELALYASLALLALWASARAFDLFWIGAWLVAGCAISNALYFAGWSPVERTGPYTLIEIMVAVATACALSNHSRKLILILVLNLFSIAANIGLILNSPPTDRQIFFWNLTTNICFAAECLVVIGVGIAHGYSTGRFRRRLPLRRWAIALGFAETQR